MKTNHFAWLSMLGILVAASSIMVSCSGAQPDPRPNILVILSDDMGFSDLGCYGGEIDTPHLDALARDGIRFTEFYSTARCWPTRATLLSGRYSDSLGSQQVSIAEVLKQSGYQTGLAGKWHLSTSAIENGPIQRGFDRFYGTLIGAGSFWRPMSLTRGTESEEPNTQDFYYTEKIAEEAVRQIQSYAASEKPFFQYVAFTSPHWPLHARENVIQKYLERYKEGWEKLRRDRYQRMIGMGLIEKDRWPLPPPEDIVQDWGSMDHKEWHIRNMAVYAAQVDHMDQAIGRIFSALKGIERYQNTVIIFTNDNGACSEHLSGDAWNTANNVMAWAQEQGRALSVGDNPETESGGPFTFHSVGHNWANAQNTPLRRYKANVHEGGACVPCIVSWPQGLRADKGSITRQRGHMVDILATCMELAKTDYPQVFHGSPILPHEGISLVPILRGSGQDPDRAYYFNHNNTHAVIKGDWKIVREGGQEGKWFLYNIAKEKTEMTDLAEQRPDKVQELAVLWNARFDKSLENQRD